MSELNFRRRMREARKARGLSQDELGRLIGRNQAVVTRIESGQAAIRVDVALAIANQLQVSLPRMLSSQPLEFIVSD